MNHIIANIFITLSFFLSFIPKQKMYACNVHSWICMHKQRQNCNLPVVQVSKRIVKSSQVSSWRKYLCISTSLPTQHLQFQYSFEYVLPNTLTEVRWCEDIDRSRRESTESIFRISYLCASPNSQRCSLQPSTWDIFELVWVHMCIIYPIIYASIDYTHIKVVKQMKN